MIGLRVVLVSRGLIIDLLRRCSELKASELANDEVVGSSLVDGYSCWSRVVSIAPNSQTYPGSTTSR